MNAQPGIYPGLPMRDYLAIDALSTTPVRTLLDQCPRAGWFKSRLNPDRVREEAEAMDIGSAAHAILLENSRATIAVIDPLEHRSKPTKANPEGNIPKGWTNDAMRDARDEARAAGLQPILPEDAAAIEDMVLVAQEFISALRTTEPAIWQAFQHDGGASEVTMIWDEDGTLCKARTDRNSNDYAVVVDYKTSGMSVEPDHFGRTALAGSMGYAFGAAWYRRGIKKLTGVDPAYVFLCQQTEAPYLCSLVGLDPSWMAYGAAKVTAGLRMWQQCVRTGQWDGYPNRCCYPELPAWESARFEEKLIGIPYEVGALFERTDK